MVKPGQMVALVGPNGAGKTTTLKLITGLLTPTNGEILVENKSIKEKRTLFLRKIGYVPDQPFFFEELTGEEFFRFTAELWNDSILTSSEKYIFLIKHLTMEDFIKEPIHTYSYGMKRKLSLLIALAHEPNYLIMDEPFNGLDPMTTYKLKEFFKMMITVKKGILLATHLMDLAEQLGTHVAIINKGEIIAFDEIGAIKREAGGQTLEEAFIKLIGTVCK